MNRQINPKSIAPPAATYAHAVLTQGASRWLHTSGVVPVRSDGTVPRDTAEQAQVIWDSIGAMLADAGMRPSDIVSIVTYVVDRVDLGEVMAARDLFMGQHRAASTLVTVKQLVRPEWRMEVAVVAAAA